MTNALKNNLLWIQFTPGAGGRILLICCTTSNKVGNWIDEPLPDPVEFATQRFCVPNPKDHMNNEPITPYDIAWYTRNSMFDRGDNLTKEQVHTHLLEDPLSKKNLSENKLIANVWQKPYVPTWAEDEKIISIVTNNDSMEWLLARRKYVFYEWFDNEVHLLRYKPHASPIRSHEKLYPATPYIFEYENADTFIKDDIKNEIITGGPGLNILLSELLYGDLEKIWDNIDEYIGEPVNRNWCNKLITTWRERWV